ncbi:hypothetical protein ABZP36_029676 [Zizania latifolia]
MDRSCGKPSSTKLVFSTKYQHNLQLAARGSSCLVHRSSVPKQQYSFSMRSSSAHVCTTFNENVRGVFSHAAEEKVGALLLNLGGPETLDDVQPFLFNLFADPVSAYNFDSCFIFTSLLLIICSKFIDPIFLSGNFHYFQIPYPASFRTV